jgi:opacity protein-like surface antigen
MMKRIAVFTVIIILCFPNGADAQKWKLRRYEAVFGGGFGSYFGDIGGSASSENLFGIKDISIKSTGPSFHMGVRYKIRQNIAVKMNFNYIRLAGDDEGSKNSERGFQFTNSIFEPSIQGEYSIISEEQRSRSTALFNKRGMINNYSQINLYLYAGIGGAKMWPKPNDAILASVNYEPAHPTFALVFPVGVGLKYVLNSHWSLGAEFGVRWSTSDYIDSYTSPYSKANDLYYFGVINGIYRIKTSRTGAPILNPRRARSFL